MRQLGVRPDHLRPLNSYSSPINAELQATIHACNKSGKGFYYPTERVTILFMVLISFL